ncbi:MAG: hypothetical protein D8M22_10650 [Armatimonadetes bacterium]|nr:hypothetical protein [Armatimonadota bacterium]
MCPYLIGKLHHEAFPFTIAGWFDRLVFAYLRLLEKISAFVDKRNFLAVRFIFLPEIIALTKQFE